MKHKRLWSSFVALTVSITSIALPTPAFAEAETGPTAEPAVQTDMEITGNSPLGDMLAEKLTAEQTALNEKNGCGIYEVQLSDTQAYVQFDTTLDCTLLLTLYDDAGENLLTSAKAEVTTEQTEITLDVPDMPESCYLRACLIDTETLAPISAEYSSALYTQEMQEFLSKTTDDFDEDLVLNLDDDKTKNFLILNENMIFLQSDATTNTAVFDQTNRTATLSNYDEAASKLKTGDTVFLDCGEDSTVFCVDAVALKADTLVITASEAKLEDLFANINIDMDAANILDDPEEQAANTKPLQYLPRADFHIPQEKKSFGPYDFGDEDSDLSGTATIMLQPSLQCYYSGLYAYAEYDLNLDVLLTQLKLKLKAKKEIPLATLALNFGMEYGEEGFSGSNPIGGEIGQESNFAKFKKYISGFSSPTASFSIIKIIFGVNFVADGKCTVEGSCTVNTSVGLSVDSAMNCQPRAEKPKITKTDLSMEGEIFLGLSVDYSVTILELPVPKLFGIGFDTKALYVVSQKNPVGFKFTVRPSQHFIDMQWQHGDPNHLCDCCYEGEVYGKSSTVSSVTSEIFPDFLLPEPKEQNHLNEKICDWHYSRDYDEFALEPCPRHFYKVTVNVTNTCGDSLEGAEVTCENQYVAMNGVNTAVTDADGKAILYLNSGAHWLHVTKEGYPDKDNPRVRVMNTDLEWTIEMDGDTDHSVHRDPNEGSDPDPLNGQEYTGTPDENNIVTTPDGVKYVLREASAAVADKQYLRFGGSQMEEIKIYEKVNGLPVTNVLDNAFDGCTALQSVSIPNSVKFIGKSAFAYCKNMSIITLPQNLTYIRENTFKGCSSLKSVDIPHNVTWIGGGAFADCNSLESIVIPDLVTKIDGGAFSGCTELRSAVLPSGLNLVQVNLFNNCSNLTSIIIPDGVTNIGTQSFYGCRNLTSIIIPDSVTSIEDSAFFGCINLTSITIPNGVTSIGDCVFKLCTGLTSITIPDSVTSIGDYAFIDCHSLTSITLSEGMTSIGEGMFTDCSSLTSVTIPDGVRYIRPMAFDACYGMTSITIPDSVTNIYSSAFINCTGLKDVYYTGTEEQWNQIAIIGGNNGWLPIATIHFNSGNVHIASLPHYNASMPQAAVLAAEAPQEKAALSRDETDLTALTPNSVYNIYALAERELGVSDGNLLWFEQAVSDENGAVSVNYAGEVFAVRAMYNIGNAECTVHELAYDGTEKEFFPTVTANGKTLTEGEDYWVSGSYTGTDGGVYSILLEGTGDYFGEKTLTYIIDGKETATLTGDVDLNGAVTITDAVLLMRLVNEDSAVPVAYSWANADTDSDGMLTIADVTTLLQALSEP